MLEVLSKAYVKQYGVNAVIARLGHVYGSTPFPPDTAIYEFINNALSGQNIQLNFSNLPRRDNIYVDDAVSGLFTILESGKAGEAYNISSGGELGNFASVDEIAETIASVSNEEFDNKIKVIYKDENDLPRKPGIMLNTNKLRLLGWKLGNSLADGFRDTLLKQKIIMSDLS
jgi:nucleoside-diphosphate-sugar epimerase